jgi:hypothetical protein
MDHMRREIDSYRFYSFNYHPHTISRRGDFLVYFAFVEKAAK